MVNTFPTRCLDTNGNPYVFELSDVPVVLTKDTFALVHKPNTPILKLGNYTRGSDIPDLFEGDILEQDGKQYVIQYTRGFLAAGPDKEFLFLNQVRNFKKVGTIYDSFDVGRVPLMSKIPYKYNDLLFYYDNIIGPYGVDAIIVEGCKVPIKIADIKQYAGFAYLGQKIFFGDLVDGRPVTMHGGRAVLTTSKGYYDLVKKRYLVEGEYYKY